MNSMSGLNSIRIHRIALEVSLSRRQAYGEHCGPKRHRYYQAVAFRQPGVGERKHERAFPNAPAGNRKRNRHDQSHGCDEQQHFQKFDPALAARMGIPVLFGVQRAACARRNRRPHAESRSAARDDVTRRNNSRLSSLQRERSMARRRLPSLRWRSENG